MVGDLGAPGVPVVRDVVAPTGRARGGCPSRRAARRAASWTRSEPVVSSHWPWPQTRRRLSRDRSHSRWSPSRLPDVVERVVEVGRRRRARPSRSRSTGRSCPTCRSRAGTGRRACRAKFAAWKAPRLHAGGDDVAAGVVVDERHDVVEDPRLVARRARARAPRAGSTVRPRGRVERVDAVELHPARPRSGRRRAPTMPLSCQS